MLSELFHAHLRDIPLSQPTANPPVKTSKAETLAATTLGSLFKSSSFVLFFVVRAGGTNGDHSQSTTIKSLGAALQTLLAGKASSTGAATSPSVRKRLFGFKRNGSGKSKPGDGSINDSSSLAVVVVDVDGGDEGSVRNTPAGLNHSGFYSVAPLPYHIKGCLLRSLRFAHSPSIIVVDTRSLAITTTQGRRCLMSDPHGKNFPWLNTPVSQLLAGKVFKQVENPDEITVVKEVEMSSLKPGVRGLYFAAKWCPPCRLLTQQLIQAYEQLKKTKPAVNFEILLCSLDRTREAFQEHLSSMPWLALPYDTSRVQELAKALDVNGLPAFVLLDESGRLITSQGRNQLLSDPAGRSFPWGRRPIYELDESTLHRVTELPSLILFTEGSPGDNEFARQILEPLAEETFTELLNFCGDKSGEPMNNSCVLRADDAVATPKTSSGSVNSALCGDEKSLKSQSSGESEKSAGCTAVPLPLQLFYTGEDPICDHLLESLGQADADLPLLVIVDTLVGCLTICDNPDVSTGVVKSFISDYREGKASTRPIPSAASVDQTTLVDASMTEASPEHANNHRRTVEQNPLGVTL